MVDLSEITLFFVLTTPKALELFTKLSTVLFLSTSKKMGEKYRRVVLLLFENLTHVWKDVTSTTLSLSFLIFIILQYFMIVAFLLKLLLPNGSLSFSLVYNLLTH